MEEYSTVPNSMFRVKSDTPCLKFLEDYNLTIIIGDDGSNYNIYLCCPKVLAPEKEELSLIVQAGRKFGTEQFSDNLAGLVKLYTDDCPYLIVTANASLANRIKNPILSISCEGASFDDMNPYPWKNTDIYFTLVANPGMDMFLKQFIHMYWYQPYLLPNYDDVFNYTDKMKEYFLGNNNANDDFILINVKDNTITSMINLQSYDVEPYN